MKAKKFNMKEAVERQNEKKEKAKVVKEPPISSNAPTIPLDIDQSISVI